MIDLPPPPPENDIVRIEAICRSCQDVLHRPLVERTGCLGDLTIAEAISILKDATFYSRKREPNGETLTSASLQQHTLSVHFERVDPDRFLPVLRNSDIVPGDSLAHAIRVVLESAPDRSDSRFYNLIQRCWPRNEPFVAPEQVGSRINENPRAVASAKAARLLKYMVYLIADNSGVCHADFDDTVLHVDSPDEILALTGPG